MSLQLVCKCIKRRKDKVSIKDIQQVSLSKAFHLNLLFKMKYLCYHVRDDSDMGPGTGKKFST